jgi:CO/xanthine dehydrogenase Mo-binding subunit
MHGMAAAYYSRCTGAPGAASEDSPSDASRGRLLASPPAAGSWNCAHVGSHHSVRESQEYLRQAGATAREMLVAAAAARWGSLPLNVLRRRV